MSTITKGTTEVFTERATPKQTRAQTTKARIIEVSTEIYKNVGRDYFTTQAVSKESGVSIGTIYRYFSNRVDLLNVVMARLGEKDADHPVVEVVKEVQVEDSEMKAFIQSIKVWAERVIELGEGKGDLKAAGEFIMRELNNRGY